MSSSRPFDAGALRIDEERRGRVPRAGELWRLFWLTFKMLWRSRARTFITLASLIFGQVMMVLAFGFTRNLHRMLPDQVCRAVSGHVQVLHPEYLRTQKPSAYLPKPFELAKLRAIAPEVTAERSRATAFGFLEKGDERQLVVARGVEPALEVKPTLTAGANIPDAPAANAPYPVLVGVDVARALRCAPNDLVIWNFINAGGVLDNVQVRVVGVVDEGIPDRNRRTLVIHLHSARKLLEIGEGSHEQQIFVADSRDAERVARALAAGLGPGVQVAHWHEFNPQLRRTMRVTFSQTAVVTFIVMVVILFGIGSTISMTAAERIREFGLLGVLGFGPRSIFAYVMCEGFVVGLSTLIASTVLVTAVILWMGVHGIDLTPIAGERIVLDGVLIDMHMRPTPDPGDYAIAAMMVLGTSLLAALLPAWRASRLKPAQALRTTA